MGCAEVRDKADNIKKLMMTFEEGKDEQKEYCFKLKSEFEPDNDVKFEINSAKKFCIKIISPKGKEDIIQDKFNDTEDIRKETLYKMLDIVNKPRN